MPRFAGFEFRSPRNYAGRIVYTLPGVPARDLGKRDVARLSPDQYEAVKAARMPNGKPLYEAIRREPGDGDEDAEDNVEAPAETGDNEADEDAGDESAEDASEADTPAE